jgi:pimeloyl-ACP methyl ester carboxylesterase
MGMTRDSTTDAASDELTIVTAHGRLYARRWRSGSSRAPLVLLHDSLGCVASWRDFPARLAGATGRDVIAYDRLGFGRSDAHPGRLAGDFVGAEARGAFAALRRELGLDAFVAFGHSVGGGMAVACAAAYPDACVALVTEAAQAFVEDRTIAGLLAAKAHFQDPVQVDRLRKYHGAKAPWVLGAWLDTWLAPAFADWTLDAALARVRGPALVIHGDRDEYGSPEHPARIARGVRGAARLLVLEACGHVPHRERVDDVLGAVAEFLATAR